LNDNHSMWPIPDLKERMREKEEGSLYQEGKCCGTVLRAVNTVESPRSIVKVSVLCNFIYCAPKEGG
jgi:hypothetical protein